MTQGRGPGQGAAGPCGAIVTKEVYRRKRQIEKPAAAGWDAAGGRRAGGCTTGPPRCDRWGRRPRAAGRARARRCGGGRDSDASGRVSDGGHLLSPSIQKAALSLQTGRRWHRIMEIHCQPGALARTSYDNSSFLRVEGKKRWPAALRRMAGRPESLSRRSARRRWQRSPMVWRCRQRESPSGWWTRDGWFPAMGQAGSVLRCPIWIGTPCWWSGACAEKSWLGKT